MVGSSQWRNGPAKRCGTVFATNKLAVGLAFHRPFANQAALALEAGMTAAGAKGFFGIGNRIGQLRAIARVAAVVPQLGNKLSH